MKDPDAVVDEHAGVGGGRRRRVEQRRAFGQRRYRQAAGTD